MNTLFTRTLLWFIATVVLTFLAMTLAAALDIGPEDRRRTGPLGSMISLQLSEAVHAWETGARDGLREALERIRETTDAEGVLTDATGRDLLTGEDRSDLVAELRRQRRGPLWRRERTWLARRSEDGRYIYFAQLHRRNMVRWFLQPEIHLTVLTVLAVLSYGFARHLTNPVRRLQAAVEHFGGGDLSVRTHSTRSDEIGALSRAFDRMADRIEVLLQAERRLLLDISHELRSPLARLNLAVELARSDEVPSKHLDRIEKEAERLNALVGELLQVTRAEGDASRMRREEVAFDDIVHQIVTDVQLEAERRGCRVDVIHAEAVRLTGDPELLRRAIENVLRNAIRYAPDGTAVDVSLKREGSHAVLCARDRGPGVPPEQLDRIFEPFYRVEPDRNRSSGGVGLGLSIARRAVELHRGEIHARNADPGLLVEIRLPA